MLYLYDLFPLSLSSFERIVWSQFRLDSNLQDLWTT